MSYYQKYLKYKTKYIELQKAYLIGGGEVSARNYFIKNFAKSPTISDNLKADVILHLPSDIDMNNLNNLFEIIYAKLLTLFESKQELDNYIDFIIKSYVNNTFGIPSSFENIGRFKDAIQNYKILQNNKRLYPTGFVLRRLDEMTGLTGLNSLEEYLNSDTIKALLKKINDTKEAAGKKSAAEKRKREDGEMDPIFESDNVLIYKPGTVQQSQYYGRETKWCTAATNHNMFNQYNNKGPLYIFITNINRQLEIRKNEHPKPIIKEIKFQLHEETNSLMDDKDKPVDLNTLLAAYNNDEKLIKWFNDFYYKTVLNIKDDNILTINNLNILKQFDNNDIFNKLLDELDKTKITELYLRKDIDIKILMDILSKCPNLTKLVFDGFFNKRLLISMKIPSLRVPNMLISKLVSCLRVRPELTTLELGGKFNIRLENCLEDLINLTDLIFSGDFNQPLGESLSKLENLTSLKFNGEFNMNLNESLLSLPKLTKLTLAGRFNKPLDESFKKLTNLTSLTFGDYYTQSMIHLITRQSMLSSLTNLKSLEFGARFNQPLEGALLNLTQLNSLILIGYNHNLNNSLSTLTNLNYLTLAGAYKEPLGDSLSTLINLKHLTLAGAFNQPLEESLSKLTNLTSLNLAGAFNQRLGNSLKNLTKLTELKLGGWFNRHLGDSLSTLTNLTSLILDGKFNEPLEDSLTNLTNLTNIEFGDDFNQPLDSLLVLTRLTNLKLGKKFKQPLPESLVQIVEYR